MLATLLLFSAAIVLVGYLAGIGLGAALHLDISPNAIFRPRASSRSSRTWRLISSIAISGSGSRPAAGPRVLTAVMAFYLRLGMGRWSGAMRLLASNMGERSMLLVTLLVFVAACLASIYGYKSLKDPEQVGSYAAFPAFADDRRTVDSGHYDDQRDPAHDAPAAYIQSMVVTGPTCAWRCPTTRNATPPRCALARFPPEPTTPRPRRGSIACSVRILRPSTVERCRACATNSAATRAPTALRCWR